MQKENLKRLKAGLLAIALCFTLGGCKKNEDKQSSTNETAIFFVQGKALIYEEGYDVSILPEYTSISDSIFKYNNITTFSSGVEVVSVKNMEDALELATAIVGEENIVYIDYKDKNMELTYTKK